MNELPFRQIHMDFHTSPHIDGVGNRFDADEFVKTLKEARVNSINLFAKCHHGMYYYPTKIGRMHPGLKFDLLGAQIEACRKEGIRTCVYTTAVWNEDWADKHPEWLQVDLEGKAGCVKPFGTKACNWRSLCLNNKGLVDYLKAELRETYELYKPDGYWIDIIVQFGCICGTCLEDMKRLGLDPQKDVKKHNRLVEIRFMKEIYEFLKDMDPEIGVFFNGSVYNMDLVDNEEFSFEQKRKYLDFIDIESLPSEQWGYTHFPIAVNYVNKHDKEITMMNGKFHREWGDFGSLRNLEALEYECFRALANGAKICVGDQLHPSGRIDKSVYHRIGQVFRQIEEKEKWCKGTKKVSQIGVYAANNVLEDVNESTEGVYRMLTELHYLFDYIDFKTDLDKYDLIILPDNVRLPGDAAAKIRAYVENGGKAILTGKSGLSTGSDVFALDEFGVEYVSEAYFAPRYVNITEEHFPEILPMDYVLYMQGASVRALPGTQTLAYITNPFFNRTWDRFCSHRQTPPAEVSNEPCITKNNNAIYVAHPIFADYANIGSKIYKDIIRKCIELLIDKPVLTVDLPSTAEATLRKQGDNLILHVLNYMPQRKCRRMDIIEDRIPLFNKRVGVRVGKQPVKVYLAPQKQNLRYDFSDGYAEFVIPEIDGHQMVVIEG